MKYPHETEEQFKQRVKENNENGVCVFREGKNRELILDIIDGYIDIVDALKGGVKK